MFEKLVITAALLGPIANAVGQSKDYSAQADALFKALEANPPPITENTIWYGVRPVDARPCPAALRGTSPQAVFQSTPGVALIRSEQRRLPDGATKLSITINVNGRVDQLEFANTHGACMALASLTARRAEQAARENAALGHPVSWTAQLPASKLLMSYSQPCSIKAVVVRHPAARGGREVAPDGSYLDACWWEADGSMYVHNQVGEGSVVKIAAITVQRRKQP